MKAALLLALSFVLFFALARCTTDVQGETRRLPVTQPPENCLHKVEEAEDCEEYEDSGELDEGEGGEGEEDGTLAPFSFPPVSLPPGATASGPSNPQSTSDGDDTSTSGSDDGTSSSGTSGTDDGTSSSGTSGQDPTNLTTDALVGVITTESVTGADTQGLITGALTTRALTTKPLTTARALTTKPLTTKPLTTKPLTTKPLTTKSLTTARLTTKEMTTRALTTRPLTTQEMTTREVTTGFDQLSHTKNIEGTVGTEPSAVDSTSDETSPQSSTSETIDTSVTTTGSTAGGNIGGSESSSKASTTVVAAAVTGTGGGFLLFGTILGAVFFWRKKKKRTAQIPSGGSVEMQRMGEPGSSTAAGAVAPSRGFYRDSAPEENSQTPLVVPQQRSATERYKPFMNELEIDYADIEIGRKLGQGNFGVVYCGEWRGTSVAVKQIKSRRLSEKEITEFERELSIMRNLRPHNNVITLYGYCSNPLCIVTEFCADGSLERIVYSTQRIENEMLFRYTRGIAAGMSHLHQENIIHRDLAVRNILLHHGEPKVADFGMSRFYEDENHNQTLNKLGPVCWMSPESLSDQVYSVKTDVYSFGCLLFEMLLRKEPFFGIHIVEVAARVASGDLTLFNSIPDDGHPKELFDLMKSCLNFNPELRPTFPEILERLS